MPDLTAITTAIQSLKTATDMVKGIRQSTASIEDATVKFQIAELTNALADLKMALADVKEENVRLKEKLAEIERHESFRGLLELRDNVYFPTSGEIEGYGKGPWCTNCFDEKEKMIALHHKVSMILGNVVGYTWECPSCKSSVGAPEK